MSQVHHRKPAFFRVSLRYGVEKDEHGEFTRTFTMNLHHIETKCLELVFSRILWSYMSLRLRVHTDGYGREIATGPSFAVYPTHYYNLSCNINKSDSVVPSLLRQPLAQSYHIDRR